MPYYTYKCPECGFKIDVNSNPDSLSYSHLRSVGIDGDGNIIKEHCSSLKLNRVWKAPADIQIKGAK